MIDKLRIRHYRHTFNTDTNLTAGFVGSVRIERIGLVHSRFTLRDGVHFTVNVPLVRNDPVLVSGLVPRLAVHSSIYRQSIKEKHAFVTIVAKNKANRKRRSIDTRPGASTNFVVLSHFN